jgi:hypothetical protein
MLGVEDLGVHRHLIMAAMATVVILVVLTLNQLEKLSSVMKCVARDVRMQVFTSFFPCSCNLNMY